MSNVWNGHSGWSRLTAESVICGLKGYFRSRTLLARGLWLVRPTQKSSTQSGKLRRPPVDPSVQGRVPRVCRSFGNAGIAACPQNQERRNANQDNPTLDSSRGLHRNHPRQAHHKCRSGNHWRLRWLPPSTRARCPARTSVRSGRWHTPSRGCGMTDRSHSTKPLAVIDDIDRDPAQHSDLEQNAGIGAANTTVDLFWSGGPAANHKTAMVLDPLLHLLADGESLTLSFSHAPVSAETCTHCLSSISPSHGRRVSRVPLSCQPVPCSSVSVMQAPHGWLGQPGALVRPFIWESAPRTSHYRSRVRTSAAT